MARYTGFDGNGIARVWGEHDSHDVAETMCREEIKEYLKRRPDTGPMTNWTILHDQKKEQ